MNPQTTPTITHNQAEHILDERVMREDGAYSATLVVPVKRKEGRTEMPSNYPFSFLIMKTAYMNYNCHYCPEKYEQTCICC